MRRLDDHEGIRVDALHELLELREDHGGNTVIRRHEDRLLLYEVGKQELTDVDTREALTDLVASQSAGKAKEV